MRNGWIGLAGALVGAALMTAAGCSGGTGSGNGSGGSGSGSGGPRTGGSGSGNSGATGSGGSGGSAGAASAVTTLASNRALNSLTMTEANQLCSDTGAYVSSSVTRTDRCRFAGLKYAASSSAPTDNDLRVNCSSLESDCNQPDGAATFTAVCFEIPTTCTATVAQFSACLRDEVALYKQRYATLPVCSALVRADLEGINQIVQDVPQAAGCLTLANVCPDYTPPVPY